MADSELALKIVARHPDRAVGFNQQRKIVADRGCRYISHVGNLHRSLGCLEIADAELAVYIIAPCPQSAVRGNGKAMIGIAALRQGSDIVERWYFDGLIGLRNLNADSELAGSVAAPGPDRAVGLQRQGVTKTARDICRRYAFNLCRRARRNCIGTDSELACRIQPEGEQPSRAEPERRRMIHARREQTQVYAANARWQVG